jgi:hypothetical protein
MLLTPPAVAMIRQLEEAPGQVVYQSRQSLRDQHGHTWQAIAFKRILPDASTSLSLRLVGFPGVAEIDHSQPLTLTTSLGLTLTAADVSHQVFTDAVLASNVGQYDLHPVLPQLHAEIPVRLTLATTEDADIFLRLPASLIEEWKTLAAYE